MIFFLMSALFGSSGKNETLFRFKRSTNDIVAITFWISKLNWLHRKKEIYSQQIDLFKSCLFIPCAMIDIGPINREDRWD